MCLCAPSPPTQPHHKVTLTATAGFGALKGYLHLVVFTCFRLLGLFDNRAFSIRTYFVAPSRLRCVSQSTDDIIPVQQNIRKLLRTLFSYLCTSLERSSAVSAEMLV